MEQLLVEVCDAFCYSYWCLSATDNWKKNLVSGVSYQINKQSALSWIQAQSSCKQQGASLLSITDPHQQAYVSGTVLYSM